MTFYKRNPAKPAQKDLLAQRIADGSKIAPVARELGISRQRASQLWAEICRDMGAQAV
jgi:hypothetical protein